jgi:DNA primase
MSGYIPEEIIEEIRSRAEIREIVSEFVTLQKRGKYYTGLCPFHGEKKPSFTVNVERQIFHCFGCGEGGNVFKFLMKINNLSFPEAVRLLAAKAGVELPVREFGGDRAEPGRREKLLRVNRLAAEFFQNTLALPESGKARAYLDGRGMSRDAVRRFSIGYAPDGWHALKNHLERKRVPSGEGEEAGLLVRKDRDRFYDRFRDRIMFPVKDLNGNVVAFGGRVLGQGEPKYLNSPETAVYTKGRVLYGLFDTKEEIRASDRAVLVEGYMDFLSLWQGGVRNVVASLGTALTRQQVQILRRFTKNVVLLFDPDQAGRHAAERSLKLFLEEGIHGWVVLLPEGLDPDAFIRKSGAESLNGLIGGAPSLTDYYIGTLMGPCSTVEEKLEQARQALPVIGTMDDAIQRDLFIRRISESIGVKEAVLEQEVRRWRDRKPAEKDPSPAGREDGPPLDALELSVLFFFMEHRARIGSDEVRKLFPYFLDARLRAFGETWVRAYDETGTDPETFLENEGNGKIREKYYQVMIGENPFDGNVADRLLEDMTRKLRKRWYRFRHQEIQRDLLDAQKRGDADGCQRLLEEKNRMLQEERS